MYFFGYCQNQPVRTLILIKFNNQEIVESRNYQWLDVEVTNDKEICFNFYDSDIDMEDSEI